MKVKFSREELYERDQRTVFASQMDPRATLREIWEFFTEAGRVEDINLVEDSRTRKSKGLAYVLMSSRDQAAAALSLTGSLLRGYPVAVQVPQAERIRQASEIDASSSILQESNRSGPARVRVSNLHYKIQKHDLLPFFEEFGRIDSLDLFSDMAIVAFRSHSDAEAAVSGLDGIRMLGQAAKVELVEESGRGSGSRGSRAPMPAIGDDIDDTGGVHMTAQSRVALMQRLQRNSNAGPSDRRY